MKLLRKNQPTTNVGDMERIVSMAGGAALTAYGLAKGDRGSMGWAALGGALLWRGYTGHCPMLKALGLNTAHRQGRNASVPYELGLRVDHSVEIDRPVDEVYRFWRQLENLPRFMDHLVCVKVHDERRSTWIAKGPAGMEVEWDAEIVDEVENDHIGWRSLEGSEVDNGGSVHFKETPGGGTLVKVSLQYNPPAGALGAAVASLLGQNPKKQVRHDLERLKELLETGSISVRHRTAVDPSRADDRSRKAMWDRDKVTNASEESFPASDPPSWTPTHA